MQFFYGLTVLMVISILSTFCLGILAPAVVFSLSTVAASFGINLILLFLVSSATSAVLKNQSQS
jgi:hypothetical protein